MNLRNVIVISDTHCGCQLGLCSPGVALDNGGSYVQSALQVKLWEMWSHFCDEWIPMVTRGEPFALVHNGDALDGVHHNAVTTISNNMNDQLNIAESCLRPLRDRAAVYYHIRGTEAHVGSSGQYEEMLARRLDAKPDDLGNRARWDLWLWVGNSGLVHFTHHVGTSKSAAYESTALYKEYIEACTEAGRWGYPPPDVVVRSHRHRSLETRVPTNRGYGIAFATPAWQLKTPFVYRGALGRSSTPQIGGYLIRAGDEDAIFTRSKVFPIGRTPEERI